MNVEVRVIPHRAQHVVGYDYVDGWIENACFAGAVTTVKARASNGPIDREVALLQAEIDVLRMMVLRLAGGE